MSALMAEQRCRQVVGALREHAARHRWAEGLVYFVGSGSGKHLRIKIGWTKLSPRARVAELQVGNPERLELLGVLPGSREREQALHARYRLANCGGEWFRPISDLLDEIDFSYEYPALLSEPDAFCGGSVADCEYCQLWHWRQAQIDKAFAA